MLKQTNNLIHCITNPISINDCANLILALGAKPIMACHPDEVDDITCHSAALALNLGNFDDVRAKSMMMSAKCAKGNKIPFTNITLNNGWTSYRNQFFSIIQSKC